MPEGPEVEACRRDLQRWTTGRAIVAARALDPAVLRERLSTLPSDGVPDGQRVASELFAGATTERLVRHGKRIGWFLRDRPMGVVLHLGMTGRWLRRSTEPPGPLVRLILDLDDGNALWFEDGRRFGCVVPIPRANIDGTVRGEMGPDVLNDPLDADGLAARLKGNRPIKVALMDQAVIAGLGNIHAAEALWRAKIHPATPCRDLDTKAIRRLAGAISAQVAPFVDHSGDDPVYVNLGGDNPFQIYGREGAPCPRCGALIAREGLGGRATFLCPRCQPAPDRG